MKEFDGEGEDKLRAKFKILLESYQSKCLNRIKIFLSEKKETKEKYDGFIRENDVLKEELDEMQEKIRDLENNVVEDFITGNEELQRLFRTTNENSSEIAQDLLKNIMKKEHEIERLRLNRRKMLEEQIELEASTLAQIEMIYSLSKNFISSN